MFDLVRRTPLEEYDGEGLFYVHAGTGMEVFHIRTSNGSYEGPKPGVNHEMVANFMFSTPSQDDKGVAHILEHTVLCGLVCKDHTCRTHRKATTHHRY